MRIAPTNAGVALVRGESLKTLASLSPYRKDKLFVGAVHQEDLVAIDMLLDAGADPNGRVKVGLGRKTTTPVHAVHAGPLQNEVRELLYETPTTLRKGAPRSSRSRPTWKMTRRRWIWPSTPIWRPPPRAAFPGP